jgi:hypothetical protein
MIGDVGITARHPARQFDRLNQLEQEVEVREKAAQDAERAKLSAESDGKIIMELLAENQKLCDQVFATIEWLTKVEHGVKALAYALNAYYGLKCPTKHSTFALIGSDCNEC